VIAPMTIDSATLAVDLRCMVATGSPESEWLPNVTALIGRPLSEREQSNLLHSLRGYAHSPWSEIWRDSVRKTARLLVAGGMA